MARENRRVEYVSLASVISCIAVVFLHTNGCFWRDPNADYWFSANIIESVFYFAVPVFFMIPGVTLLDFYERYSLKDYLIKRVRKTVIPYVAWSLLGLIYQMYVLRTIDAGEVNPRYIVDGLLTGELVPGYWFFIPLFGVYLSIPLLALVPKDKRREVFRYLVFAGLLFNITCPFIINVFGFNLHFPLVVGVASGYLIYVMAGWLIDDDHISGGMKTAIYILAFIGFLAHLIGTYKVSTEAGEVLRTFKGYLTLPCVLYSLGAFLLIRQKGDTVMKNETVKRIVSFIGKYTFSIYLLHRLVLMTMTEILGMDDTLLSFRLIAPFFVICICVAITVIIRKIPVLRQILPA